MKKVMPVHPSLSEICRKNVQRIAFWINHANIENDDMYCIEWCITDLAHSYYPNAIKYRTAKLLRHAIRNGKIKDNPNCVKNYHDWVNEIIEIYGFDARYI